MIYMQFIFKPFTIRRIIK